MTMRREIILHVGAHKTASSFLQTMARDHNAGLREAGLSVIHRRQIMKSAFHDGIVALIEDKEPDYEAARANFDNMLSNKRHRVLFTNEDLVHRFGDTGFYPKAAQALRYVREIAGDASLRVILYTRAQADYIESLFMQFMHLGRTFTFEQYVRRQEKIDLSWHRVLEDMASVIGRENVTAIPYESVRRLGSEQFYQNFLSACGVAAPERFTVSEEVERSRGANRSYSAEALNIARTINPLLDKEGKDVLRKFLQENYSTATHPKAELFTPDQRDQLRERYRECNQRLFEDYMSDWPAELRYYV